jgi:hypothetical protein
VPKKKIVTKAKKEKSCGLEGELAFAANSQEE